MQFDKLTLKTDSAAREGVSKKLSPRTMQFKRKQLSSELLNMLRSFVQTQMQTNICLCNDNKAQLSARALLCSRRVLSRSHFALSLSLSDNWPSSPHPLSKRAHLLRTFQAVSKVNPTELLRQQTAHITFRL